MRHALTALSLALLLAAGPRAARGASVADAWEAIAAVRSDLAASGHLQADFTQTYTPAGFTQGESERGRLALALPDCLRWDYTDPFPKSFLLCGKDTYAWNPGETTGRHGRLEAQDATGLDLLLLPLEQLRLRYEAALSTAADGTATVALKPRLPAAPKGGTKHAAAVASATLTLDPAHHRLLALAYRDAEGNLTRFDVSDYRVTPEARLFEPPAAIAWQEAE